MALEQNKQCFLHRWLCPRTPGVFSLAIQGVTFYPRSQQKRATPTWCYSPHSTTLRFGALSSVAHTLMRYLDLTCELVSVQALPKHLHHLLPAFRVARFTRSAPHRHLLFQVTFGHKSFQGRFNHSGVFMPKKVSDLSRSRLDCSFAVGGEVCTVSRINADHRKSPP